MKLIKRDSFLPALGEKAKNSLTNLINYSSEPPVVPASETYHLDDRPYRVLTFIVLGAFVAIFGIWAALAPLSSAVPAIGKVSVEGKRKVIQHLEGGIVSEILVRDSQKVKQGELLVRLDDTRWRSELEIVRAQYLESLAKMSRLEAEKDRREAVRFPAELGENPTPFMRQMMEAQNREFIARQKLLRDEDQVMEQRIEQLENQVRGLRAILESKEELLTSYQEETKEWQKLYDQQLIDKMRLRDVIREKTRAEGEIANIRSEIAKVRVQITEVKSQNALRHQDFLKGVLAELSDVERRVTENRARIVVLQDMIVRSEVASPVEGIVVNLQVHTIGAVVAPGRPIVEVVPEGEALIIEGRIAPQEVNYIHKGMRAEVRFAGFSHIKSLKPVIGELVEVSADSLYDEAMRGYYYTVKIRLLPEGMAELARNHLEIMPGMPADAMILTGERTLLQYIVKPFKNMFIKGLREQ